MPTKVEGLFPFLISFFLTLKEPDQGYEASGLRDGIAREIRSKAGVGIKTDFGGDASLELPAEPLGGSDHNSIGISLCKAGMWETRIFVKLR